MKNSLKDKLRSENSDLQRFVTESITHSNRMNIRGTLVNAGLSLYVIPTMLIREIAPFQEDNVVQTRPLFKLYHYGQNTLPLVKLGEFMQLSLSQEQVVTSKSKVIILRFGTRQIALLVDSVGDEQEYSVTPSHSNPMFPGEIILKDYRKALYPDIDRLLTRFLGRMRSN